MHACPWPVRQDADKEVVAHSLGELRSFLDELKHGTKKYKTIASLSGQIAEAYRGRCVLELLQNAHDALADSPSGDVGAVTFALRTEPDPVLLIANSGRAFEREDFKGLCRLGQSPKDPNKSVGNKGLGFRSVLEVTSAPEIWSTAVREGEPAFVFRFDPGVSERVTAAFADLNARGLKARSPFDSSEQLVDWSEDQLRRYRERMDEEDLDGPAEARGFLSPYDFPLPIEGRRAHVDELLRDGHVTVVCLPLDGGRTGHVEAAVASIRAQLKSLVNLSTTLFLTGMTKLTVDIDGDRTTVRRRVNADKEFGQGQRGRCQEVVVSRTRRNEKVDAASRFRVWTWCLGGKSDQEWAERIQNATRHLPNKWPEVDRVEIGVAVQQGEKGVEGRFVIFLPTEMPTETGAHINAPFFGSLDRRQILLDDEYNRLLLDCVLDLSLQVVEELASGEPNAADGRAIVDILSSRSDIGQTGRNILERLRERSIGTDSRLEDRLLILSDTGWASPGRARAMPKVPEGVAISAEDWRRAAAFSVVSGKLDGRQHQVKVLLNDLGGSPTPTNDEWARTVEQVAARVQSGEIDSSWDGFLGSVLKVLPLEITREPDSGAVDPLASTRFLPDQGGRLISASDPTRVFFQPIVGIDDAAELVETVPDSLKKRIAFIHSEARTHEEGAQRRRTEVHKFLDGRFARGFGREEIVRDAVLPALPQLPEPLEGEDAGRCAELLNWTIRLLGDEPSEAVLALLEDLPVACHGGWYPARKASFGPGWPGTAAEDLELLCDELRRESADRLRETLLLPPGDPRWGAEMEGQEDLLARIGVVEGLHLRPVDDVRFHMSIYDYELPRAVPAGVDIAAWESWRNAVRHDARPGYKGHFAYSLENTLDLPELNACSSLSQPGRRAFSRLVVDSMLGWPEGWRKVTIRKVQGERRVSRITSPLQHWLSTMSWLSDGSARERPLADRWLVPTPLLRGQNERYRHLRPLSLDLSNRLDPDLELRKELQELGLNVYPTDDEKIGPELLDALADAWREQRVLPGQFDVFLGQLRHGWQRFDEGRDLPRMFVVQAARRRFEVLDRRGLRDAYLIDDAEKGRSLREGGARVLEMELREANRLGELLAEETGVRRASELVERVLIDGREWSGGSDRVRELAESRFRWLPEVLLTVAAHGGSSPTGHATKGWDDTLRRLQRAGVVECQSIAVELTAGTETIAKSEPVARWLSGDVLAVDADAGTAYEALAPAVQAMLGRQDLLTELRLVLLALHGLDAPTLQQLEGALEHADIDTHSFADIRSRYAGNTGHVASRLRPLAALLGASEEEFEAAALDVDGLADWLADTVPQWEASALLTAARRSRDDREMGLASWRELGEVAQLPTWNAVLKRLGGEYEPVENEDAHEQSSMHVEAMRALLAALARAIAVDCGEPRLFRALEETTQEFVAPDEWSKRWWEVPFSAVVDALHHRHLKVVDENHLEVLRGVDSPDRLGVALERREIEIEPDPYDTARVNGEKFKKVLIEAHDLYRSWLEMRGRKAPVPETFADKDLALGAEAHLGPLSDTELWHRALTVLGDRKFTEACGEGSDLSNSRARLDIDEEAIKEIRRKRAEQEEKAARRRRQVEIAGEVFEIGAIDYSELLRRHFETLSSPSGPRASEDEFTPLVAPGSTGSSGGGGGGSGRTSHRRPSAEEAEVIGVVGEMHAYRYLRGEFGGRAVRPGAWVSQSRLGVYPLVEGEKEEVSDGHGFDFRFNQNGIKWHVEVKATKGDEPSFNLGVTEIEAATRMAGRRGGKWRWRILRVRDALSEKPKIDWLPNPFEEEFGTQFRLHRGGMTVSYKPKGR